MAFIAFAESGIPRTTAFAGWMAYNAETRSTAIFGAPVTVASAPYEEERALWVGREVSPPFGARRW